MPLNQPGKGDVHVDVPLTNVAIAFTQKQEDFVAGRLFPDVPVAKQTNKYFTIPKGEWFRDEMEKRAPGAEAAERTHLVSSDSYSCDVWALKEALADQIRANYDNPLQPEREMTEGLMLAGLIRKEKLFLSSYYTTGLWTLDQTGVGAAPAANQFLQWDVAASTPIEDIRLGKRNIKGRTGYFPNKLCLSRDVYDVLLDHPDIVARLDRGQSPGGPAIVMRDSLAALFELDEILVMDGVENTATEGAADSISFIGSDSALLVYAAPSPGLYVPSAGYTFSWSGLMGSGALGTRMKRMRKEEREADSLEIQMAFDQKLVSADLGQFFTDVLS